MRLFLFLGSCIKARIKLKERKKNSASHLHYRNCFKKWNQAVHMVKRVQHIGETHIRPDTSDTFECIAIFWETFYFYTSQFKGVLSHFCWLH